MLVLTSATAFGVMPILTKEAYAHGLSISQLLPVRFGIAAAGLLLLSLVIERKRGRATKDQLFGAVVLGTLFALQTGSFFLALQATPASVAVLLLFTFPALIAVFGRLFLGRATSAPMVLALGLGFIGLILAVGTAQVNSLAGVALALVSAAANAVYFLYADIRMRRAPAFFTSGVGLVVGAVVFTAIALFEGSPVLPGAGSEWFFVCALAAVPLVGLPTLLLGVEQLGAVPSAVLSAWEPVIAVLAAVTVLAEPLTVVQIVGSTLVVMSVVLAQLGPNWNRK